MWGFETYVSQHQNKSLPLPLQTSIFQNVAFKAQKMNYQDRISRKLPTYIVGPNLSFTHVRCTEKAYLDMVGTPAHCSESLLSPGLKDSVPTC